MAHIVCPSCGEPVPPAGIDLWKKLATCACGDVFVFLAQVRGPDFEAESARLRDRVAPHGWTVGEVAWVGASEAGYRAPAHAPTRSVTLTRRWLPPDALRRAAVCVLWDSIVLFVCGVVLSQVASGGQVTGDLSSTFVVLGAHVASAAALTYYTLALLLNRTVIALGGREVSVRHGPLWWPGARRVSLAGARRVWARSDTSRARRSSEERWEVAFESDTDREVVLLGKLPSEQDARFVAAHVAQRQEVVP